MASGLTRAASKHSSARSLGSFVDVGSASSSDFDPVDLEEEEASLQSRAEAEGFSKPLLPSAAGAGIGKNATPPGGGLPPLRSVPEQRSVAPSPDRAGDSSPGTYAEPLQEGLHNLEHATQKAAEMAKDFTNKLFTSGAAEARSSVMRLAGDVSSWWAALDPVVKQPHDSPQETARSAQESSEVQDLFGLSEDEELLERFGCSLVQTMECRHNPFSKPQQVKTSGKLYITNRHTCFTAEGIRFAIPHFDLRGLQKAPGPSKALRLDFGAGEYILLDGFQGNGLDSALGLLEHARESA